MESAAGQLGDSEYHNWLRVGLGIRITTDGLQSFCARHGNIFYIKLIQEWKQTPTNRNPAEPEWSDGDLPAIKCTIDGSAAGSKYGDAVLCPVCSVEKKKGDPKQSCTDKSKHASQQRKDFAEVFKQHHINSTYSIAGTTVPADKAATNKSISYEHCNASRWGDVDGWFEVFKAYIQMQIGTHEHCLFKTSPEHLDICGLTAGMNFCDGFSHCVDQRTKALPAGHPLRVA